MLKKAIGRLIQWAMPAQAPEPKKTPRPMINYSHLAGLFGPETSVAEAAKGVYSIPKPAPGVIPQEAKMAVDSAITDSYSYATLGAVFAEGLQFMGYPYLAELTQRSEYRRPAEIIAREMTRKWIKLTATGEDDKTEKLAQLEKEMERLNVRALFRKAAEHDGFFGRAQIFIDTGEKDDRDELKSPLVASRTKVKKGGIKGLHLIEPIWTYPGTYNANDPLDPTFFKPQTWYVMGKEVHATRLLTFVSRPVPDLLKPAYAFGGLSLSQMIKPYVDNWLRTRQSVSDLIHSFTVWVLKANLGQIMEPGGADNLVTRIKLFNQTRDNRGLNVVDKDSEDFENVSTPLGTLDTLQAQAQEQQASVSGIPITIQFGSTPAGLNATADGEVRVFYSGIESSQETTFRPNLQHTINLLQVSLWGEVDGEIGFIFEPLWSLDETELATARKTEAETDGFLIDKGVIDPGESRARIAAEEDSPYASLDLNKVIAPPDKPSDEEEIGKGLNLGGNGKTNDEPKLTAH